MTLLAPCPWRMQAPQRPSRPVGRVEDSPAVCNGASSRQEGRAEAHQLSTEQQFGSPSVPALAAAHAQVTYTAQASTAWQVTELSANGPTGGSLTLEAAVKATSSAQQLVQLMDQHGLHQLSPQELLLFCNQLSKVQKAAATTVRSWTQAQVRMSSKLLLGPAGQQSTPGTASRACACLRALNMALLPCMCTQALLQQLLDALDPHLSTLSTYELVVLIAALARLRHAPSQTWLSRFFSLCEPKLKDCGTGNLAMLARAVSSLGLEPWVLKEAPGFRPWWDTFLSCSCKRMHAFRSDELIRVISSMADLQHKPHAE